MRFPERVSFKSTNNLTLVEFPPKRSRVKHAPNGFQHLMVPPRSGNQIVSRKGSGIIRVVEGER